MGSSKSSAFNANNGIPQGSVISPLLFNVMFNYIFENVGPYMSNIYIFIII